MNKYLYFAVIVPINEIIEKEGDITKGEFDCALETRCGKSFEGVFDGFLEAIAESDGEGFVARVDMDDNEMPIGPFRTISKSDNCSTIDDCFAVKFKKTIDGRRSFFDAEVELNEYGGAHLFDIVKALVTKRKPLKKQQPIELSRTTLTHFENVIEEKSGAKIVDEVFYLNCIVISLSNTDKLIVYKKSQNEYTWDEYTESYWFKNKERILKEHEPAYIDAD